MGCDRCTWGALRPLSLHSGFALHRTSLLGACGPEGGGVSKQDTDRVGDSLSHKGWYLATASLYLPNHIAKWYNSPPRTAAKEETEMVWQHAEAIPYAPAGSAPSGAGTVEGAGT